MALWYGCRAENNTCEKKDTCQRVGELPDATLWKVSCNDENHYVLYIPKGVEEPVVES